MLDSVKRNEIKKMEKNYEFIVFHNLFNFYKIENKLNIRGRFEKSLWLVMKFFVNIKYRSYYQL